MENSFEIVKQPHKSKTGIRQLRLFIVISLIFSFIHFIDGQNAPLTTAGSVNEPEPGLITVPITVTNFNFIGAISLTLDYDHSVLNYVGGIQNPSIPGWFIITDNDLGNGFHRILMGWYGNPISLPDGTSIMDIEFIYIDGSTTLAWFDQGGNCEYVDGNSNILNDVPISDYYFNGFVCGSMNSPDSISGITEVCQGANGVLYSIPAITNATAYNWTVPPGATITNGQNTNAITVYFTDSAVSGLISVEGINQCTTSDSEQLFITVNELPVADAGDDITIPYETSTDLTAADGGTGSYSYNWLPEELLVDPNVQNPETVLLTTSNLFVVSVSDNVTECQNSDSVLVSISGGPLSASPIAAPSEICLGETSQLYANPGGGSGNYSFNWTSIPAGNPPWSSAEENPIVSPDSTKVYQVEVSDGFTTSDGQTTLTVNELPSALISGGDTLCGDTASLNLTVDLTGIPPWSFIYSYQSSTIQVEDIAETPYLIIASDSGAYVLLEVEDKYCSGTTEGSAVVEIYPVPDTPLITYQGTELISNKLIGNQWYFDGEKIEGATEQKYTPNVSGEYFDIVSINTCNSDTSNKINVTVLSDTENSVGICRLGPNPATDFVKVEIERCEGRLLQINICSSIGQVVRTYVLQCTGKENELIINVSQFNPGLYFVNIFNEEFYFNNKLIVK